jgi:hypothetical protein
MLIFCDIKGIDHKDFAAASQAVNSAYYGDVLWQPRKNLRRLTTKLVIASQERTVFHQGIFDQMQYDTPTLLALIGHLWLFCFPKWNYHHFNTIEAFEAES